MTEIKRKFIFPTSNGSFIYQIIFANICPSPVGSLIDTIIRRFNQFLNHGCWKY